MTDITEGIELFNTAHFFEAHDYFEALWIESSGEERLFYQGMVQMAVGCFHLISGNYKGSLSQFNKGTTKLKNYVPKYYRVNVEKLLKDIDVLRTDLNLHFENRLDKIDLKKIPKLDFTK